MRIFDHHAYYWVFNRRVGGRIANRIQMPVDLQQELIPVLNLAQCILTAMYGWTKRTEHGASDT